MSITTITASRLAFVKSAGSSSWDRSAASQGAYGSGSPRVGAILFSALRDVDWARQEIRRIELSMRFGASGGGLKKTIGLYCGANTAITGTGSAMRGAAIGEYVTADTAFNKTLANVFDTDSDPEVFAGLVNWLQSGESTTLVLYRNESTGEDDDYSRNYLKVTECALTIEYELAGSGAALDHEIIDAGGTIALTISPMSAEGTVSHSVEWRMGDMSSGSIPLGTALTASYAVPMDWLYQIPSTESGPAECVLTTYVDGEERSARSIPFTVAAPASVIPTLETAVAPDGTMGGYYQCLGGAKISAAAYSAYGADIAQITVTGSESVSGSGPALTTVTTPTFATSGAHEYTVTATDTRGRAAIRTLTIDVAAYTPPSIAVFSAQRYVSRIDDAGNTVYVASPAGEQVWFDISAAVDPAGGNNAASAYIQYGPVGGAQQRVNLTWPSGSYALIAADDRSIIAARIPANAAYSFQLTVKDNHASATATVRVEISRGSFHVAGSGYGVALGGFSDATALEPSLRSYWPVYGPDGYRMDATAAYHAYADDELGEAWQTHAADTLIVSRIGALVQLEGTLAAVARIAAGSENVAIVTLPEWARPRVDHKHLTRHGYSLAMWDLRINADGAVTFGNNQIGGEATDFPSGRLAWIRAMWFAADAIRPVEKRVYVTIYLTHCTISNAAEAAIVGAPYSAAIAADEGYALSGVRVYMGGEDVTADALIGSEVSITTVTGPIVIEAVAAGVGGVVFVDDGEGNITVLTAAYSDDGEGNIRFASIGGYTAVDDGEGNITFTL